MRHEITKTESFLLILDDTDIKIGDWYYLPRTDSPHFCTSEEGAIELNLERYVGTRKILAHLPLEGMTLYGLDLLPSLEQEEDVVSTEGVKDLSSFVRGYDKATNKYDVIITKLFNHLYDKMESISQEQIDKDSFQLGRYRTYKQVFEFIQSLSKPKIPIGFECEYQSPEDRYYEDGVGYTHNVKRINNSQGQTQWVGKYIYA